MKRILFSFIAVSVLACTDNSVETESTEVKAITPTNLHGFTMDYSASFVMDSATNTESVLALWKDWKSGDLANSRSLMADTVSLFLADGTSMSGPADTILKNMQSYRSTFQSMEVRVDAIFATKSTDKDEHWVAVWGVEMPTDMKGKKDTVSLQETWRFNKAGKVDMMFQATRKGMLPPPPAK